MLDQKYLILPQVSTRKLNLMISANFPLMHVLTVEFMSLKL